MVKRKPNQMKLAETEKFPSLSVAVPPKVPASVPYPGIRAPPAPRQRGRPRKVPLDPGSVNHRENSVDSSGIIMKVVMRTLKEKNKPPYTANNGFARGLKPDIIMTGFRYRGHLIFIVRFKNRKLPELVSPMELKLRAPSLLIYYYVNNMHYTYNLHSLFIQ